MGREIARVWYNKDPNAPYPIGDFEFSYDGANTTTVRYVDSRAEFLHGGGLDDPLRGFMPNTGLCTLSPGETLETYFTTEGTRLLGYYNSELKTCIEATPAWRSFGRHVGAIQNSHSFEFARGAEGGDRVFSYFRNRWYDASSGRFMSEDPPGYEGGMNLYAYGNNSPASYTIAAWRRSSRSRSGSGTVVSRRSRSRTTSTDRRFPATLYSSRSRLASIIRAGPTMDLRRYCCAFFLAMALLPSGVHAQREGDARARPKLLSQLSMDLWDDRAGLPQNSVQAVVQTADSYLWLGTQRGLVRFDGVSFTTYDRQSTPALTQPYIWALAPDAGSGLWIGTEEDGVLHLDRERVTRYSVDAGLPVPWVRAILHDSRGTLWLGTIGGGLGTLRDGRWHATGEEAGVTAKNVFAIVEDRGGTIWAGTGPGLVRMDSAGSQLFNAARGLPGGVLAVAPAAGGGVWAGTGAGVVALVRGDSVVRTWTSADGIPAGPVFALREDLDGALWIAGGGGVARLVDGVVDAWQGGGELAQPVNSIGIDHEGSVWLGTSSSGLARLRDTPFTPLGTPEGLSDEMMYAVLQDRDGRMWLGTGNSGVDRVDGDEITRFNVANGALPDDAVFSLAEAPDGTIWVGTGGGLASIDGTRFTHYGAAAGLIAPMIRTIAFDEHGAMWIGANTGMQRFSPGPPQTWTAENGLPDSFVLTIHPARAGGLWIGTRAGLTRMRNGAFITHHPMTGAAVDVSTLVETDDGTVWMGGMDGIARLRDGRLVTARMEDGLCEDMISSVVLDGTGRVWFGSNAGIFVLTDAEFEAFASGRTERLPCRLHGRAQGMRSRETNGAINPPAWRARDGRIWYPTVKGIVIVDPSRVEAGLAAPPVVIEALITDDSVSTLRTQLAAGTRSIEFEYAALSFIEPQQVRFRYRLDGVDDDWIDGGGRRRVRYTNLGPGRYTFHVRAANAEGGWNDVGASHAFVVLPLFHETRWFRAALLITIVAAAAGAYYLRVRSLTRRQHELLLLVDERTRAEARYRDLFENAVDAVFTTSPDGRFTAVNRRFEDLTGYTAGQAAALNVRALLPQSAAGERVATEWLAGAATGTDRTEIIARDGTRVPVEVNSRLVHDAGNIVGVQALARDIRARDELERQLRQSQKMEAVGQLAGGVAHDFNNLLTVIRGNGEILLGDERVSSDARADLEQIVSAAERASALTRQLLAFSRKQVVQPGVIDLNELVRSLDRMITRLIGEDIRIVLRLSPEPCFVLADPGQLEQVLINLAINARDAMPAGGTLTISSDVQQVDDDRHAPVAAPSGRYVLLTVADSGQGMDAATQSRIFEPFFTTKEAGKGTGLGLSTVYGIVNQAGGQILCQSEPGRGTSFRIYLPLTETGRAVSAVAVHEGEWRGTETILLVEDDDAVRGLTRRLLRRSGYTVLEASDGASALRIADDHPGAIHLLLTDMVMPGMNGREVADSVLRTRPGVRALLMSGYTDDEILRRGLYEADVAFLNKPFTASDLGRAVRGVLDR